MTTRTSEILTRPGLSYQLLVPRTRCYKWTKLDTLQFKWKTNHSRSMPLAAKVHTTFLFCRLRVHNMWCCFYGLGHKMTGCFCLDMVIVPLAVTRLEQNAEFVTLTALSW